MVRPKRSIAGTARNPKLFTASANGGNISSGGRRSQGPGKIQGGHAQNIEQLKLTDLFPEIAVATTCFEKYPPGCVKEGDNRSTGREMPLGEHGSPRITDWDSPGGDRVYQENTDPNLIPGQGSEHKHDTQNTEQRWVADLFPEIPLVAPFGASLRIGGFTQAANNNKIKSKIPATKVSCPVATTEAMDKRSFKEVLQKNPEF
ncbi:hypothetical protein KI387_005952, partial [Taxus chinensis]